MMKKILCICSFVLAFCTTLQSNTITYKLSDLGIKPNTTHDITPLFNQVLDRIKAEKQPGDQIKVIFEKGTYNFHSLNAPEKEYYISNHDQDNPKRVGFPLEGINNLTIDGRGADFIFHGRMIPFSLIGDSTITLKNFSIDFALPHIAQVEVTKNDTLNGVIEYRVAPWVKYEINEGRFFISGEKWKHSPSGGIAFENGTKHLVYNTSDIGVGTNHVEEIAPRVIRAKGWKNKKLIPGTVIAMRTWHRPTPGIFVSHCKDVVFDNVKVHYAEGMGLLAQMTENITLDRFGVSLRGKNDPRYFTSQADATHFSGCKGLIKSVNGLYEGMMDDAINVHGTYLKVTKRIDDNTVEAAYQHDQSWGFEWGRPGDEVQFVAAKTMELTDQTNKVKSIMPIDKPTNHGAKVFRIEFEHKLESVINENNTIGIENLEWTPEVIFANNVIRNNRARGTLFSTPKRTIVENNYFDHTSGTAILLCGDCNGWFETGACREVIIRKNHFRNALTNMFQFTNAVISIYPEIPDLKSQTKYFHGGTNDGIIIENNLFETFDAPLLYAKSVDGLKFRNNKVKYNKDYKAFHWNNKSFFFERVRNVEIKNNNIKTDRQKDVKALLTPDNEITIIQ